MDEKSGLIMKAMSGFYYVKCGDELIECRARGVFRKRGQEVFVGDTAKVEMTDGGKGYVVEIAPRKNVLVRPPLANIDQLVMVISTCEPVPNLLVIDRLIAIAERKSIDPLLVFTKKDRADSREIADIYRHAGFRVIEVSNTTGEGIDAVRAQLSGKISAFSGNSGVGKSSLLNRLDERLAIPTAEISQKLGRGRHTTRHVELFPLPEGGYVADTPGFSSLDLERCETILKEDLAECFREFADYSEKCKFTGCSHTKEKGCAVLAALERGEIEPTRHESYVSMWNDVKDLKEWELK
ncbi:ribosome small subunit-dependent GTPase A [Hydrogenoanaerobacterium sp.]|uniref:ribosome small subunit-dependent GTPase A n=1 Tax=Hydrogenoanaerobacterium sp. TaxID=2953763 RepID=UPI00289C37A8|nr:ribosome small subunit-dependent GTPase A [Hydrogenoanaerobacterium sp.]